MNTELNKALDTAKIGLLAYDSTFLTTVAFSFKYVWDDSMPTAAVDGINVYINPEFFLKATPGQRVFVIAHESWHVALNHLVRKTDKDGMVWNQAGDYVINQMLKDRNFEMWDWVLQNDKYRGWTTNAVYDDLIENPPPETTDEAMGSDVREPTQAESIEVEAKVKEILVKAVNASKIVGEDPGNIPAEITREIEKLLNPVLPWEMLLSNFLSDMAKDDYTWRRPNKRFAPDFYLPTQYSESLGNITIAIDTSGSISKQQLTEILSEISYIKERFKPKNLTILDCDYVIHNVFDVTESDDICDLEFSGGGGTAFEPVIKYCDTHPTQALLYFTELYADPITEQPDYPVLWLCYSKAQEAEIGQTIYYESKK